jgi:hypothetical protein
LSGKDLASKPYSHLDNPDFGGQAKRQEASFTTPKFYAQPDCIGMFFDPETFGADQFAEH